MDIIQKHKIKIIEPENPKGTIMFGNGFGTDQTYWNNITPKFEKDYKIVHYENIGANNAGTEFYSPNKYDNLNTYSRDLINICKHLDLKDIIFVTHSVSGMIGLLASNMDESLFSKIIFIGASPRYLNDDGYTGGFNSPDLENLFETMRANYFAWASGFGPIAMNTPGKPELSDYFVKTLSAIRPDIAISVAKTIFYSDHREDLPKFNKPSLIVKTREDIAVPSEVSDYLYKHIKGSSIIEVEAKGHYPHFSSPEEIIRAITSFLN